MLEMNTENEFVLEELKERLIDLGYEDSIVLENPDYASAVVGVDSNGRVIYDFNLMVDFLVKKDGISSEEAIEFIEYNTIRALPYAGENCPIIMYPMENFA